jgi:hypothetical protein
MSWTGFNWTYQHPRFVADITGDGRADIVGLGRDGVWASLNSRGDGIMQIPRLVLRDFGENAGSWHVDRQGHRVALRHDPDCRLGATHCGAALARR